MQCNLINATFIQRSTLSPVPEFFTARMSRFRENPFCALPLPLHTPYWLFTGALYWCFTGALLVHYYIFQFNEL